MKEKRKMLYFMNVDWSWIRQRPHILAKKFDDLYDVTVLFPQYITRPWRKQYKTRKTQKCNPVFQIPFEQKSSVLSMFQDKITYTKIGDIYAYDILWFSSPVYAKYIPEDYNGMIVYDNMDDNVALQTDVVQAERMEQGQEILFEKADVIFVTSKNLFDRLPEKVQKKAYLIRNGSDVDMIEKIQEPNVQKEIYHIGYLGTISEWFDFKIIKSCIEHNPNIRFDLFGPNLVSIPQNKCIISHGVIEHSEITTALAEMDCLIMPFVLNEIVLAVDPVKLYEYIGLGKCIISIKYPEIERFADFVYFYEDEDSCLKLVSELSKKGFPPKYNEEMQKQFLKNNSWKQRVNEISNIISANWRNDENEKSNVRIWNKTRSN